MNITLWTNDTTGVVRLHQLSDNPEVGTVQEQIVYLSTLNVFAGYSCVLEDFTGTVPDALPRDWRWNGSEIISA